jgi:phosphate transport system substrate-binding protein
VSKAWQSNPELGVTTRPVWIRGATVTGNSGVVTEVKANPFSIGYVDLNFALAEKLTMASVKNKAGNFVQPTLKSISAALNGLSVKATDLRINAINTSGAEAYPIVTATYVLLHHDLKEEPEAAAIAKLLWWMTHEGQQFNESLFYVRVPDSIVSKTEQALKQLTINGKPIFAAQ